jgi:hypothetical protein
MRHRISPPVVGTCIGLFVVGIVTGWIHYLSRSPTLEAYVPGSSAIVVHVVLAAIAGLTVIGLCISRRLSILAAPFMAPAFERFRRTVLLRAGISVFTLFRALLSLFFGALFLYNFWRAGDQVIGGLDPNYVVNAWGGPFYLGASLAHWLDTAVLLYVQACLLHLVMVRRPATTQNK